MGIVVKSQQNLVNLCITKKKKMISIKNYLFEKKVKKRRQVHALFKIKTEQ